MRDTGKDSLKKLAEMMKEYSVKVKSENKDLTEQDVMPVEEHQDQIEPDVKTKSSMDEFVRLLKEAYPDKTDNKSNDTEYGFDISELANLIGSSRVKKDVVKAPPQYVTKEYVDSIQRTLSTQIRSSQSPYMGGTSGGGEVWIHKMQDFNRDSLIDGGIVQYDLETGQFLTRSNEATTGYEFTGGFTERTTGTAGASDVGSNVSYTSDMVAAQQWLRFGFDTASQAANDQEYWGETSPDFDQTKGLFGGLYMPPGITSMFDFSFDESSYSDEKSTGDIKYTAATGSYDFTQGKPGDLAQIRFDFNVRPQIANTTLEAGLIWQTRRDDGTPTFTFALTGTPVFFGQGTVEQTFLQRETISAYFASNEDVNARVLPAIRANNPVQIQPLTTLTQLIR